VRTTTRFASERLRWAPRRRICAAPTASSAMRSAFTWRKLSEVVLLKLGLN